LKEAKRKEKQKRGSTAFEMCGIQEQLEETE
jgi:hypothetical protein